MREDAYGKMFFGILAVIIIFLFPIIFIGLQMQRTAETRANEYTEAFVDNCRASGYFTLSDYQRYVDQMGLLGLNWDIQMYHYSSTYTWSDTNTVPVTDPAYDPSKAKMVNTMLVYTRDDIAQKLSDPASPDPTEYKMKKGDMFEIIAVSKNEFIGANFVHIFDRGQATKIYVQVGEMIDNNPDRY